MLGEDGKQRESAGVIGWLGKCERLALWLVHGCGGDSSNSQPPRSTSHDHVRTSSPRRVAFCRQVHTETARLMGCLAYCAMHKLGFTSSIGCRLWLDQATCPWSSSSPCHATRGLRNVDWKYCLAALSLESIMIIRSLLRCHLWFEPKRPLP